MGSNALPPPVEVIGEYTMEDILNPQTWLIVVVSFDVSVTRNRANANGVARGIVVGFCILIKSRSGSIDGILLCTDFINEANIVFVVYFYMSDRSISSMEKSLPFRDYTIVSDGFICMARHDEYV
jgi:hypothetical protein